MDWKPDGLGRVLTGILEPQLLTSNHSAAAHACGEWFYNFGWVGVLVMVPVLGLVVRGLDVGFAAVTRMQIDSRRRFLILMVALLPVAAISNLMWVGSFTYVARTGQQLLIIVALTAWSATGRGSHNSPQMKHGTAQDHRV